MKRRASFFLSLALVALVTVSCRQALSATATIQPPTVVSPEAVEPTQTPVTEPVSVGDLPALIGSLHWLGHASFRLDGPPVIYIDPTGFQAGQPQADIVLISHGHQDHFALSILKQLSTSETVFVTSHGIAEKLKGVEGEVRALAPGEQTVVGDVKIETVPAYNIGKSYHPQAAGNLGFIVALGGERLYFAGDTDRIPEMADIQCDVALLPIGGTYTMDVEEAAAAAADIGPRVAVPMHARSADPEQFRELCDCEVVILEKEN
jgi:L-ascorbate metabolism protein UlaG (beta-lactamase superfamily)